MAPFEDVNAKLVQVQNLIASAQDSDGGRVAVDKAHRLVSEVLATIVGLSTGMKPLLDALGKVDEALLVYGTPVQPEGERKEPLPDDIDAKALAQAQTALREALDIARKLQPAL